MTHPHPWREPVAAANVMIGATVALVATWAWLVCEAQHPGENRCGPTLACLLLAGLLDAASGFLVSFDGKWASRAAAAALALALVPAGLFVAGVLSSQSLVVALVASACWLALLAEACMLGTARE
ncbi:MAG: hypothetical protein K2W96_24555 [Gemmataceae bacterium]|nr:hypothetical protein [Gemmataceae bacterium]